MQTVRVAFALSQRDELLRLGLSQGQVSALEGHALPLIAAQHAAELSKATRQDVRDELSKLKDALDQALLAASRALDPPTLSAAAKEASFRLDIADFDEGGDGSAIGAAHQAMLAAAKVVNRAAIDHPSDPVRRHTANPVYVDLIHRALIGGLNDPAADGPIKPFLMAISAGMHAPFRRVVEICFDAAKHGEVERPIKAFMRWRARRTEPAQES